MLISSTSIVKAECTPTPDCVELGYVATSCEGRFVRCPFDTSKLFCAPCDSTFRYSCNSEHQTGKGVSCNGKYTECACSDGYRWDNGVCKAACAVGMIYYSDNTCSSTYNSSKTIVGVVVKENELVMSKPTSGLSWGKLNDDIAGLTNYSGSSTAIYSDYAGKENTLIIVAHYGESATTYAGVYCYNYYPNGMVSSKGNWYLPATGELYSYLYQNYSILYNVVSVLGWSPFNDIYFWSSTESTLNSAWNITPNGGFEGKGPDKNGSISVICFTSINIE